MIIMNEVHFFNKIKVDNIFEKIQYLPLIPGTILFFTTIYLYSVDKIFFLRYLVDDAFYYFIIAENVLRGQFFTFDGITTTNGFHPLWVFIIAPFMDNHAFLFPLLISIICITASRLYS